MKKKKIQKFVSYCHDILCCQKLTFPAPFTLLKIDFLKTIKACTINKTILCTGAKIYFLRAQKFIKYRCKQKFDQKKSSLKVKYTTFSHSLIINK